MCIKAGWKSWLHVCRVDKNVGTIGGDKVEVSQIAKNTPKLEVIGKRVFYHIFSWNTLFITYGSQKINQNFENDIMMFVFLAQCKKRAEFNIFPLKLQIAHKMQNYVVVFELWDVAFEFPNWATKSQVWQPGTACLCELCEWEALFTITTMKTVFQSIFDLWLIIDFYLYLTWTLFVLFVAYCLHNNIWDKYSVGRGCWIWHTHSPWMEWNLSYHGMSVECWKFWL